MRWSEPPPVGCSHFRSLKHFQLKPCSLSVAAAQLVLVRAMPAPHGTNEFDYPEFARYDMRHNPGYDFVRMLGWCNEASKEDFRKVFAGYARNPLAVLLGGAA